MPSSCCAFGCFNSKSKDDCRGKTFFRFPLKNPELLNQWIINAKLDNFKPAPYTVICSDHFEEDCFVYQPFTNRRQLKPGSVPNKFIYSQMPKSLRKIKPAESALADSEMADELDPTSTQDFPKDETLSNAWCHAIGRTNFKPSIHSKLLPKHFQPEDFESFFYGNPKLKKGSVPTIFDHLKNIGPKSRKPSAARNNPAIPESPPVPKSFNSISEFDYPTDSPAVKRENSPVQEQETLACRSSDKDSPPSTIVIHSAYSVAEEDGFVSGQKKNFRDSYVGDFKFTDLASPSRAQQFIELITEKLRKRNKTICSLKRTNKRLNNKILSMEKQIEDLKRKLDINGIA